MKTEKVKKLPLTFPASELSGYATMLTKNGEVLIPLRKIPPGYGRFDRVPKLDIIIHDKRLFSK